MRECLIIGKPNAGKSLFFVNFARYLGVTQFRLGPEKPPLAAVRAAEELVKPAPHYTRRLFRVILPAPSRDGPITVLTDSVGLTDHAAAAAEIRKAMAETLRAFRGAAIILHIVDVTAAAGSPAAPGPVDRELAEVARRKAGYALLANKMDLPGAREGLKSLGRLQLPGPVIAVSALAGSGFPEVRHFLLRG